MGFADTADAAVRYDATFRALDGSDLMRALFAEAHGDQHVPEIEAFSSCCWWTLGHAVAGLRLQPGNTLVDLGCGRGGPGAWLARAFAAQLIGVDVSPVAVELAAVRAARFGLEHTEHRVGTLDETDLPDAGADGAVCFDAVQFAPDRPAALQEARRILRAGARLVVTTGQRTNVGPGAGGSVECDLGDAGFAIETRLANPFHGAHWRRVYALWERHADELRADLGDDVTQRLLDEAANVSTVTATTGLLLVAVAA